MNNYPYDEMEDITNLKFVGKKAVKVRVLFRILKKNCSRSSMVERNSEDI